MLLLALILQSSIFWSVTSTPLPAGVLGSRATAEDSHSALTLSTVQFYEDAAARDIDRHFAWLQNVTQTNSQGEITHGLRHRFTVAFKGYSALLNQRALEIVSHAPEVESVETFGASIPPSQNPSGPGIGLRRAMQTSPEAIHNRLTYDNQINADLSSTVQDSNRGWNANRLSHRKFAGGYKTGTWTHNGYLGQGATVYVLDTGVNLQQPGFSGSEVVQPKVFAKDSGPEDVNGHGTMCAGVVAGHYAGLAPGAKLVSLKVAGDDNTAWADDVAAGIEYVIEDKTSSTSNEMKVISLSQVGFSGTPLVNTAISAAINAGVHVVVSAGNDNVDACTISPANQGEAIVVGSINAWDTLPIKGQWPVKIPKPAGAAAVAQVSPVSGAVGNSKVTSPSLADVEAEAAAAKEAADLMGFDTTDPEGTNWGACVTVFAPGIYVPTLSAHNISSSYHYWGWGTSIAAPQVAALIAARLSQVGPTRPMAMKRWLVLQGTKNQIRGDIKGSPNVIAFNGILAQDEEVLDLEPIAPAAPNTNQPSLQQPVSPSRPNPPKQQGHLPQLDESQQPGPVSQPRLQPQLQPHASDLTEPSYSPLALGQSDFASSASQASQWGYNEDDWYENEENERERGIQEQQQQQQQQQQQSHRENEGRRGEKTSSSRESDSTDHRNSNGDSRAETKQNTPGRTWQEEKESNVDFATRGRSQGNRDSRQGGGNLGNKVSSILGWLSSFLPRRRTNLMI